MYKVVLLMGKSGAGKDQFLRSIQQLDINKRFHIVIPFTTRPKREGEEQGTQYNFVTDDEFNSMSFISITKFNHWQYGIKETSLAKNKTNLIIGNLDLLFHLMLNKHIQILKVYEIYANKKTRLLRLLNRECAPDVNEIVRRYQVDIEDYDNRIPLYYNKLDYDCIQNEDFEQLIEGVSKILRWAESNK